jgi:hypothetical protein
VTAAGRRGPRLHWRPRPGNLIYRRGAALALPILLAAALNVAAVAGLARIAGFRAVYASLLRIQWPWLCAVPAAGRDDHARAPARTRFMTWQAASPTGLAGCYCCGGLRTA